MTIPSLHYGLKGRCQVSVLQGGIIVREYPMISNLILNQGLDKIASNLIPKCFEFAVCGTGSTPTEADGGANTISISSGTVTVSVIGFLAGDSSDVGKTIKLTSSGNTYLITSFISTTQCVVSPASTIGPDNFFVYNTNQVGLATEVKRSNTYLTGAPNCQTFTTGNVTVMTRTYDFTAEGSPITYNEVGFSETNSSGSNLFSRVKLPTGVPLLTGQQLRVQYSVSIAVSPVTPQTYGSSPIIGWAGATGTMQHIGIPLGIVSASNGSTQAGTAPFVNVPDGFFYVCVEPAQTLNLNLFISSDASAHGTYGTLHDGSAGGTLQASSSSSYVAGTYTIDKFTTFPVGAANATNWRSFNISLFNSGSGAESTGPRFLFDTSQTKLSTFTLTLGFRLSWGRVL